MRKIAWFLILAAILPLAGCGADTVTLYFPPDDGDYLVAEERTLDDSSNMEQAAILALMEGPHTEGLINPIPEGTRLLDCTMDGKVAVLDFSEEIRANHPGGSMGELLTIYAIADTMGKLPTVERVKILVEGREIESLLGHMDTSQEIDPDWDLIRE